MKKTLSIILVGMFLVSMVSLISAISTVTYVSGKVYESDHTTPLDGANVSVNCNNSVKQTISGIDGSYMVSYSSSDCDEGYEVSVVAQKGDKFGSDTGIVHDFGAMLNFAVVNVTVPEFTVAMGLLTLLASVGVFFFIKRE